MTRPRCSNCGHRLIRGLCPNAVNCTGDLTLLTPVMPTVARHVTRTARLVGCTCPTPDVRWNTAEAVPVVIHGPTCPLRALNPEPKATA